MLGLHHDQVRLVPYSQEWPKLFSQEAQRLHKSLQPYAVDIEHIGSTSIPGMVAKPILDIAIGLWQLKDIDVCVARLGALGYTYKGEQDIPGWHFFTYGASHNITQHLHLSAWNSDFWLERVLFRDYLRQHKGLAEAYVALKKYLAEKYARDRAAYTAGKSDFIRAVINIAREDWLVSEKFPHDDVLLAQFFSTKAAAISLAQDAILRHITDLNEYTNALHAINQVDSGC